MEGQAEKYSLVSHSPPPLFRLRRVVNEYVHFGNPRHTLLSSMTRLSSSHLISHCISSFPGLSLYTISYAESRLHQDQFDSMRSYLQHHLRLASLQAGQVLVIEGLDLFCPANMANEAVVEELLFWLDEYPLLVIGLVSGKDTCSKLVRSKFNAQLDIPLTLEAKDRVWALKTITSQHKIQWSEDSLRGLAESTNGSSFEDLYGILSRSFYKEKLHTTVKTEGMSWDMVAGQNEAKTKLESAARVLWDNHLRSSYTRLHVRPVTGILLHGPPGTGKTLLATVLAKQTRSSFHAVTIPELVHAEIGKSEQSLAALFKRAIAHQPSIIFIDELDAIFSGGNSNEDQHTTGRKLLSQLMMEFDKLHRVPDSRVLVIGATNCLDLLDTALLRFGRFEQQIAVLPEPGYQISVDMILRELISLPNNIVDSTITSGDVHDLLETELAGRALSGAQVMQLVSDAKRIAMRQRAPISLHHFKQAINHL